MDRHDLIDRLPGSRLRQRLPSVWSPREPDDATPGSPPPDTPTETDLAEAAEAADTADATLGTPIEDDVPAADEDTEADGDGGRLRTALLALSAFGAALSVGAAVAWRLLGRGEDGDEDEAFVEDVPPEPAPPAPTREEGTAALLGLGFLAGVAALRDRLLGE